MPKSVRVSNGTETLEIQQTDLAAAAQDGYVPTERVIIVKGKEKLEIDPKDLPDAMKDGYNFLATKKKVDSGSGGSVANGGTQTPSPSPSVSPSASSSEPAPVTQQPVKPQDIRRQIVDFVKGKPGYSAAVDIQNNEQLQKAIPGIVAKQKAKAITATNGNKRIEHSAAPQTVKEAVDDPLVQVWVGNSADPLGQIQDESVRIINTEKYPTTAKGLAEYNNRLKILSGIHDNVQNGIAGSATTAAAYLKTKGFDVDALTEEQVGQLKTGNKTEQAALNAVDRGRLVNKLLDVNSIEDAAVQFAASQNPTVARQVEKLGSNYRHDLPNSMQGQMVYSLLNNPDVIARAEADPVVKEKLRAATANFNNNFPDFAKTRIANLIAQERENRGGNNAFVNIVGAEATDKLVDTLIKEGKLTPSDKAVYEKAIRPDLGVIQSLNRGLRRIDPVTMAFTDEAPIATPGVAENFQNSLVNTLHGAATSIEDLGDKYANLQTGGAWKPINDRNRLYDVLDKDHTAKAVDPQGVWHKMAQNTGHLTGFMVPMILGGEVLGAAGAAPAVAEAVNAGLMFEGENSEQALRMFPDNPGKQYAYTAAATAGDMFLTKLLPTKQAATGLRATLREEIVHTVENFTEGKITAAAAKESLLKKATQLAGKTVGENAKLGATLAGFNLFHNGLDVAFGGRDISLDEAANGTVESFMSGLLGGTLISAASAGKNRKITASQIVEMASRPEYYKKVIEEGAKADPALAQTANERIANLNEATLILKEVESLSTMRNEVEGEPMTKAQKEKYLLEALNQKVFERKAKETTDDVIRADYEAKAKEAKAKKEAIFTGNDPATEHESFAQPEESKPAESNKTETVEDIAAEYKKYNEDDLYFDKKTSEEEKNRIRSVEADRIDNHFEKHINIEIERAKQDLELNKEDHAKSKGVLDTITGQRRFNRKWEERSQAHLDKLLEIKARYEAAKSRSEAPTDDFGYKEKIAAATTEEEKAKISKDYADYLSAQTQSVKPEEATTTDPKEAEIRNATGLANRAFAKAALAEVGITSGEYHETFPIEKVRQTEYYKKNRHLLDNLMSGLKESDITDMSFSPIYHEGEAWMQADYHVKTDKYLRHVKFPLELNEKLLGLAKEAEAAKKAFYEYHDAKSKADVPQETLTTKPVTPEERNTLLQQAREVTATADIKGFSAEVIKDAAENDPVAFDNYLKNISEQAADPLSRENTIGIYGKELVDIAEKLHGKEADKAAVENDALKDVEGTVKALGDIADNAAIGNLGAMTKGWNEKATVEQNIAESYHADKAAGKETELTKAVESLLGKTEPTAEEKAPSENEGASTEGAASIVQPNKAKTTTTFEENLNSANKAAAEVREGRVDGRERVFAIDEAANKGAVGKITEINSEIADMQKAESATGEDDLLRKLAAKEDIAGMSRLVKLQQERSNLHQEIVYKETDSYDKETERLADEAAEKFVSQNEKESERIDGAISNFSKELGATESDLKWGDKAIDEDLGDRIGDNKSAIFVKPHETSIETEEGVETVTDGLIIELITVNPKNRGEGLAKKRLQEATAAADKNGLTLFIQAVPQEAGITEAGLKKLYESFGFKFDGLDGVREPKIDNENTIPPTQEGTANEAANTSSEAASRTEAVREQSYTTKTGKYSVKYDEKGNRVVVDKEGNPVADRKIAGNVLREHDRSYDYNFGERAKTDEIPGEIKEDEVDTWIVQHSTNPTEIAEVYKRSPKESSALNSVESAILEQGIGKVKNQSFKDFSDKGNITTSLAKSYLNEGKGRPLDVIAKEISDASGVEVTPEDVANMMIRFPNGLSEAAVLRDGEVRQQAAAKFEQLTGIPLNDRIAEQAIMSGMKAEERLAKEAEYVSEPMDAESVLSFIEEESNNTYYDQHILGEVDGEPTENVGTDKGQPENMGGDAENTATEVAGNATSDNQSGSSEKVAEVGANEPPAENGATTVESPSEDWTPINKAQLTEAETLLKKFPFGKSETWDNSVSKGIASLAKESINSESLYETASRKVTGWAEQIKRAIDSDGKSTFNPSDEEIAQMAFHRVMTNKQIGELESDLTSPIEAIRNAAELTMDNLQSQKEMVDYVLHNTATTAGRAFNIRQMVGRIDSENNLQVKRMEIIRKQGGEPLSEKQELTLRDISDESAIIAKERAELEKKKADQDFEAAVKIEVERRLKEKGANKTTSIKEGGKKVADVIRRLKMPKGGLRSDFTLGTWDIAIEGIAKIVEGGASIADAVKKLIEDKVIAFKDENARNSFEEYVTNYEKHDIVGRIEELANEEGSNTLTKSAVGEGAINDLVRHYIDKGVRGNEILERVHQDLQSAFPEISKQDIRDAYLKEGEYRFEKKEDINRETQAATQQLKTIAKLQTDLSDLQNERELRKRSGEKREPTAEEKSLQSEKEELLKKKRVEEVNKRIKEVNDRLDVLKNNRNKKTERVDADIEAARKRLQSEIGKLGLKLERGSKDEKALKEAVAEQHNKRADNIIEGIDKRLTDPKITAQERAALENAKKSIEKSKISPDSALDLSRAISKAHENIELGRKELASISSLSDLKKQTGLAQVEMGRDQISAEQQILLDRYKKTLQNKINENNRRIAAKEYLDKEPTYLKSTDVEAIKLEIQERQVNAKFNKLAKDAQWQNMSRRQKAFNVIQNLYIASLVGHMSTLAKVAASAVTKQPLNTITSQTFGRIGGRIFSKIRPALRGEGAESLRKEIQRYKAHYGVMGETKMLRIAAEGKEKAQQANEKYNKAKDRLEELETIHGTDSKEYKSFLSGEYKKAETAQKQALLDNISNSMYEWIGGNSFKDAAELFLHSAPQLEQILGKSPRESWGEYNKREKVMFVLSSIAATHGVLKNFSARAEFAASFVARLENKMRNGIDISTPDEILKTVNESYINFQRGKYQEDNPITGGFKAALNGIEKMGERNPQFKTAADVMTGLLKFENPIVRTPINIAKEAIVEYALGVPVAIMKYIGALKEAKTEAKTIGVAANEMKQYLREYMAKLDPDKADFIYRAFRKGGFGLGMMALAATGAVQFGGFYNRDDRRKKSEKLGVGEIQIGDYQLSKLQAKILTHTSAIFPLLLWTNYARVKEKQERKGKDAVDSNWEATKEDIQGMIDQVPIGTEFQNPLRGVNIPVVGPIMQDIAEGIDTDESGNKIERKPTGNVLNQLWQGMEMRIPVVRENVPKKKK